jgi:hypothetical protein
VKVDVILTNNPHDEQLPHPKGPMIPGKDGLSLDQMNLLRGMIHTGKLKVDPPSGLDGVMKGLDTV